ncbi:MAG: histidinol-phosphate transaminase [Candidatus Omnitrophota bacterium]
MERVGNPDLGRLEYLRLDKNEDIIGFPPEFVDALKKEITSDFLSAYPETGSLYRKIADHVGLDVKNIYVTAGSDAAIKAVFEVFVKKGDNVVLLDPTYAMFYVYADMFQARLVKISYDKDLSLSAEDVIKAIDEYAPALVCIANPNSPTGTVISPKGIKDIACAAAKHDSVVLLDEAYYPFYADSSIGLVRGNPNLVVTRTFSKAMGLASARIGFAAAGEKMIGALGKVRPMYETNAFAVKFAEVIMDNYHLVEKNLAEVKKSKRFLEEQLRAKGIPHFKSHANFILIDVGSFERSVRIGKALFDRKILIKSGFKDPALRNCIRISIGSVEQMTRFMENLEDVI